MPPASNPVETAEMTKKVENISIAEPNFDQIKTYWETNEKLESIFALRKSGKAINNYDFEFIIQPRLATFTSLQGNLETDPKEQLRDLIRKSYFIEAFNLAGSIINHQIKDPGNIQIYIHKVGRVFPMVAISILPHAEFGRNDYREDPPSNFFVCI